MAGIAKRLLANKVPIGMVTLAKHPLVRTIINGTAILLVLCNSFTLITTYHCHDDDPEAMERVSGFYGPGAYYAWIITSLSALAFIDFECLSAPSSDNELTDSSTAGEIDTTNTSRYDGKHTLLSTCDAGLLATIAYPLIASVDVLQSVARDGNAPQRRAALVVVQLAQLICCAGITAAHRHIEMRTRRARVCIWSGGALASALAIVSGMMRELPSTPRPLSFFFASTSASMTPNIVANMAINATTKSLWNRPRPPIVAWIAFNIVISLGLPFIVADLIRRRSSTKMNNACAYRLDWPIPRSGVSIRDLDQAAALGVAVICSGIIPFVLAANKRLQLKVLESPYISIVGYLTNEIRSAFNQLIQR